MKLVLHIHRCSDPHMWYAGLVGQTVPYLGTWSDGYKSREPAGCINIVRFEDANLTPEFPTESSQPEAGDVK